MKRRELLWLFLPCFLLAGLAWYFSVSRPGEFLVIIEETKVLPATQWDVATGVRAKVLVKTRTVGLPTDNSKEEYHAQTRIEPVLISQKTGKVVPIPPGVIGIGSSRAAFDNHDETIYYLPVNTIPAAHGALDLRLTATSKLMVEGGNIRAKYVETSTPTTASITVRPSAAPLPLPALNRYRPFEIRGFRNTWRKLTKGSVCRVEVIVNQLAPPEQGEGTSALHCSGQLLADNKQIGIPNGTNYTFDEKTNVAVIDISLDTTIVPNVTRNVILKGRISINECWPVPFEVTLRKYGKDIIRDKPEL
jgi:hypothetical protein